MRPKRSRIPTPTKFRRHWMLTPGSIFLNHGSFGACPSRILQLQERFRQQMEAEPVQFLWRTYDDRLDLARTRVARFVGAHARDVVFVTNATTGVNAILRSVRLGKGDEIVTTNHDYNACHNVLVEIAGGCGAKVVTARVPFPIAHSDQIVASIMNAVTRRTRLALIDHVSSSTALVFPVERIVRQLEEHGIETLVDGAHAPGMVSLNLQKLSPSYYTANLHKWVCAPKGTAFLWVRADKQSKIHPAVISHGNNTARPKYSAFQDRFDWAGTFDPSGWLCAGEAIDWMENLYPGGWPEIRKVNRQLAIDARKLLCERLQVAPPCPENMLGSMATIPLPAQYQGRPKSGKIDEEQSRLYDQYGIEVPFFRIGNPATRYLRISAQLYNSMAEYDFLASALESKSIRDFS